jgi:hypothetical protein
MRRYFALLTLGALLLATPVWSQGGTTSSSYLETFTGAPTSPVAYHPPGWDVQIHSRDDGTWQMLEPMHAQHGPGCEPPLATHPLDGTYPPHVFQCGHHVMTAIQAGGYGLIYLTPPALVDFSTGPAVIRWEMSTLRTALRDWVDVWVTPVDDNLALPLQPEFPDSLGQPRRAIDVKMSTGSVGGAVWTTFMGNVWRDFSPSSVGLWYQPGYETVLTPDAARRDTFELHLSPTHIKMGMPQYNLWWIDEPITTPLDWSQGVVQFGHHSYNPCKDHPEHLAPCTPNTWHWDNVSVSPHQPFSITPLSPRHVGQETATQTWTLPAPSVAGARLRFAASSNVGGVAGLDLSTDGGTTWATVRPQPHPTFTDGLHSKSYWVALPTGTTSVQVRGYGGWWGTHWRADDPHVWVMSLSDVPTPQPTPTPLPPATLTALPSSTPPPTATPESTPTVPPHTATPAPTHTPAPPATPTVLPGACVVRVQRDGVTTTTWSCE